MYKGMIAVTNRHLCQRDFLEQIEYLAATEVEAIVLREKDLTEEAYKNLAIQVMAVCERYHKLCILHNFIHTAEQIGCKNIHLPLSVLAEQKANLESFEMIGTSVHSVEEALLAQALGATYIFAGHIFETDCKKGLPGRGIHFLREVCQATEIPVYAIGGVTPKNLEEIQAAGAKYGCMMSLSMQLPIGEDTV